MGLNNLREARTQPRALSAPARVELVLGDCPGCRDYDDARRNSDERRRRERRVCYTHADDRSKYLSRFGASYLACYLGDRVHPPRGLLEAESAAKKVT
jgi:hypothetical protein